MSRPDESTVPVTLRYLLEVELDRADDDAAVAEATEPGELVVDGERRTATVQRAGARFWAARCTHADCLLTVVARDWDIASTRLASVTDVEPLILARRAELAALRARTPCRRSNRRPMWRTRIARSSRRCCTTAITSRSAPGRDCRRGIGSSA